MSYERLTSDNAAVLFIDHQTGLANGVQTQSPPEFINNVRALATIGRNYKLPSIVTTSAADVLRDNLDENGGGNQSLKRRPAAKV